MKKEMVKVKLLVNTAYQGPRKEGDVISVPEDFAARWTKNGIAAYFEEPKVPEPVNEQVDVVDEVEPVQNDEQIDDYSNMSAKDLYALCKERGLEVEAKKGKEYYIEKLNA